MQMRIVARTAAIAAAIFVFFPVLASADIGDDPRLSAGFRTCMDRAQGVTASMRACMNSEQNRLEADLNAVYRDLMSAMPAGEKKETLRNSERAWISHRETECQFEASEQEAGTLKPVLVAGCWLKQTADRVDELRKRRDFEKRWR